MKFLKKITGKNRGIDNDLTSLLFEQIMNKESPEKIKELLEKGADVNAQTIIGLKHHTPLMSAIAFYFDVDADIIKLLIDFGANVNARNEYGSTPLIFAAVQRNIEAIKILVKLGADIDAKNDNGNTPLICATITNAPSEVIKTLIELGADVTVKNNEGKTAFDYTKDSVTVEVLKKAIDKIKN